MTAGDASAAARRRLRRSLTALLVAFVLHNAEEVAGLPRWARAHAPVDPSLYTRERFVVAVVVLTALVAALTVPAIAQPTSARVQLSLLAVGGLLVNALSHIGQSLSAGAVSPGLVTAVLLLVPAGVAVVITQRALVDIPPRRTAALLGLGAVASFPLILITLLAVRAAI